MLVLSRRPGICGATHRCTRSGRSLCPPGPRTCRRTGLGAVELGRVAQLDWSLTASTSIWSTAALSATGLSYRPHWAWLRHQARSRHRPAGRPADRHQPGRRSHAEADRPSIEVANSPHGVVSDDECSRGRQLRLEAARRTVMPQAAPRTRAAIRDRQRWPRPCRLSCETGPPVCHEHVTASRARKSTRSVPSDTMSVTSTETVAFGRSPPAAVRFR